MNLTFKDVPAQKVIIKTYLIDSDHSNSYEVWKKMGSPQHPTKKQISTLEKAGKLQIVQTIQKASMNGEVQLPLRLQRQAVALVTLSW